jgi:hypothetical protein
MAERAHRGRRRRQRACWRTLAIGSIASAAIAFYLVSLRGLSIERGVNMATQPGPVDTHPHPTEPPKTAFESTDWDFAPVALVYIGALVLLVISCLVLIVAYPNALPDVSRALRINPPGPRLQINSEADLERFRAEEAQQLNGYHWIDKQKGIVHIPIDMAMQKLARTGIEGFPKAQQ